MKRLLLQPGSENISVYKKKHNGFRCAFWQGQRDSNSRHAVLETAALPAELYPYCNWWAIRDSNPGPSGYEPEALTN